MPLMEALNNRSSSRDFSAEELDSQTLSNLMWAAWGINREDGRRTAPSASNKQELELYVSMKSGVYKYNAQDHMLVQVSAQDVRKETGKQAFVEEAPVNIVFVADETKKGAKDVDAGFISQNIYLYCASEGLITVVRLMFDADAVSKALNLSETQVPVLTQTVGKKK
jgi:SagB-type dehydrogenase family enzyme